jgi:threonylcarbamoyladenosine tRNA methylthiotransferase MtaB
VTSKADLQSRQSIAKALKSNAKVIVTGCYADLHQEKIEKIDNGVQIISNRGKEHIISHISRDSSRIALCNYQTPRSRPIIKVQDGCNNSCTYCIIPSLRGKSRSVAEADVLQQVLYFESQGFQEVVLSGVHLGAYGLDLWPQSRLSSLLTTILSCTKIGRIRLSSIEANEIDERLLEVFTDSRICKHLHVPLQSGDDNILQGMNRPYNSIDYMKIIKLITKKIQKIGLGTDIIVGFPGEDWKRFENTVNLIELLPFSYLHLFPYSPRPQTKAFHFPGQVNDKVKKERMGILKEIGFKKKKAFLNDHVGGIYDVVVEHSTHKGFAGTTSDFIKVVIESSRLIETGMLINVRITHVKSGVVHAVVVSST